MKKTHPSFIVQQIVLTGVIYLLGFLVFKLFFESSFYPFLLFLPILFLGINIFFYNSIGKSANKNIRGFTSRFILLFGVKVMILLVFIVIYAYFNPQNAVAFLITFFVVYLINTVFVIIKILNRLKNRP